jgi:hypothetical protein
VYSRSRLLSLIGLPVVAGACILIALSADPTDASPKATYAEIFAVVGAFVFLLLFVQGRELAAAKRADAQPTVEPGAAIEDPMAARQVDLWAAMSTGPLGDGAELVNAGMWGLVSNSRRSGWIICGLIFVFVPATYLLETFVPLLIGAVLIVGVAIASLLNVFGPGGGGSDGLSRILAPLGLAVDRGSEDPDLVTRFAGTRHGRPVEVLIDEGGSTVRVATPAPEFTAHSSQGGVVLKKGEPGKPIEQALFTVPVNDEWRNLSVAGGPKGISLRRKDGSQRWLPDLWLAERLAAAAESGSV